MKFKICVSDCRSGLGLKFEYLHLRMSASESHVIFLIVQCFELMASNVCNYLFTICFVGINVLFTKCCGLLFWFSVFLSSAVVYVCRCVCMCVSSTLCKSKRLHLIIYMCICARNSMYLPACFYVRVFGGWLCVRLCPHMRVHWWSLLISVAFCSYKINTVRQQIAVPVTEMSEADRTANNMPDYGKLMTTPTIQ